MLSFIPYPRFLAMGVCMYDRKEIVMFEVPFMQKLNTRRLIHELGHSIGLKHSKNYKSVMYPYLWRGIEDSEQILAVICAQKTTNDICETAKSIWGEDNEEL